MNLSIRRNVRALSEPWDIFASIGADIPSLAAE